MSRLGVARPTGRDRRRGEATLESLTPCSAEAAFRRAHPPTPTPPRSTSCAAASSPGSTPAATSTSTTPAPASTPTRSSREHLRAAARRTCSATRTRPTRPRPRCTELVERARARVLEFFQRRRPTSTSRSSRPNATGALQLVGEAYPFRPGDRFLLTFDNHNSVNGIREFARARGAETTYVPSVAAGPARRREPAAALPDRHAPASTTTCSPTRRSRTSPACSTRSSGSSRPTSTAGTCCSTPPPSCPPTGSTSPAGIRTSSRSRSTRCSAGRPASAPARPPRRARQARAALVLRRHDRRRVRAARVVPVRPGAAALRGRHGQLPQPARRRDRPATSSTASAWRRSTRASPRSPRWLLDALGRSAHADGSPAATVYGPRDLDRRGATIAFNFLHPDGRVVDERYVDRVARRHNDLAADRLLLQPGRRRGRVHDLARDARRRGVRRRHDPRRLRPTRSACPPAAPSAPRSGSPPTSPTSTASMVRARVRRPRGGPGPGGGDGAGSLADPAAPQIGFCACVSTSPGRCSRRTSASSSTRAPRGCASRGSTSSSRTSRRSRSART